MANIKGLHVIFLTVVKLSICIYKHPVYSNDPKNLSTDTQYIVNGNQYGNDGDNLWYPRGDKDKLSALSSLWSDYYKCSIRSLDKLTQHGQVPSTMLMVYVGAVARLPCSVCAPPDDRNILVWMYAELPPANKSFERIQYKERMVTVHNHLHIYNVKLEDAGMYRCQIGDSSSLALLEVVDVEEKYTVVKPATSRGPYEVPPISLTHDLRLFTSWSPWSACSVCGKVGRRRRYGLCYVKLDGKQRSRRTNENYDSDEDNNITMDNNAMELLETFPEGIPCRSRFLPSTLRHVSAIQQRTSEIMIGLCKVSCQAVIFKARSAKGDVDVLETANNTAGIYSLKQVLPKQPPLPARDTIFAEFGHHITIRCPGTTLNDVPLTWRCGTKLMVPRDVDKTSGGRIYINSRDHLVINKVLYRDANVYSCWQRDKLAGAVHVWARFARGRPTTRRALVALVALTALILVFLGRMYNNLQRKLTRPYVLP